MLADLHSHLVPGVDDGARSVEDVIETVGRLVALGVDRIVTTPHLTATLTRKPDLLRERLETVERAFDAARDAVANRFPTLRFGCSGELMLDHPEPDLSDLRLAYPSTRCVLVEWPGARIPPSTVEVVQAIVAQGVRPLIAHAERYVGYDDDFELAGQWRQAGAWLQVNYGGIWGAFGIEAKARALSLLAKGYVDCLSTDSHGRPEFPLMLDEARNVLSSLGGGEAWSLLTSVNPNRILDGLEPEPVPHVVEPVRLAEWWRRTFRW